LPHKTILSSINFLITESRHPLIDYWQWRLSVLLLTRFWHRIQWDRRLEISNYLSILNTHVF